MTTVQDLTPTQVDRLGALVNEARVPLERLAAYMLATGLVGPVSLPLPGGRVAVVLDEHVARAMRAEGIV